MVTISIEGDRIHFEVQGWDRVWTLRSQLSIPLSHIAGVAIDREAARGWWHGLKLFGTNMPGIVTAGTFYQSGGIVFYDVHDPEKTIVLELDHETYKRLIVEVENPEEAVAMVKAAIGAAGNR
jgi:hypothetical protein